MSEWSFPTTIEIFDKEYEIRDKCDYRIILDVIKALTDEQEENDFRMHCAMFIFFETPENLPDPLTSTKSDEIAIIQECINEITRVIRCGENEDPQDKNKPKLMDWEHDFNLIVPAINRVLGYDVRDPNKYTHWYTFIGAFGEIGDCYFAQVMNIRTKRAKGKKLDENDKEFYKEHRKDVDLPIQLSDEEQEWLDSDW